MDAGRHPNIEVITLAQLTRLQGSAGKFKATVHCQPRYVKTEICTGCGDCEQVCPEVSPNQWDLGLGTRKAIYRPYPQAVPSAYVIDMPTCLNAPGFFVCERCRRVCKLGAIEHDMQPYERELEVGAVIVATGFDEFHPLQMKNYGYGRWPNVVTSLELERLLNASGPTQGQVIRPSDQQVPKNLVFIQCVGARGETCSFSPNIDSPGFEGGRRFNCSRYCCMNAVKDALLIRQHQKEVESCSILYTDIRAFGKGFDQLVVRARGEDYINFIRGRPGKLVQIDQDDLEVFLEDTEKGEPLRIRAEMVVLSCAGIPRPQTSHLAEILGIEISASGFFAAPKSNQPVESSRPGVFICGSAGGPRVIPECVAQASSAAIKAGNYVQEYKLPRPEPEQFKPIEPGAETRIGVFICHCGANIGRVIEIDSLVEEINRMPQVVYCGQELFACADSGQKIIQEKIQVNRLNRVVVAACTPRTHEPVFQQTCSQAGLNPFLLEMANIRDQCTWVHSQDSVRAYGKALDLIRMAVARAAKLKPLEVITADIHQHVLVIGGGVAGLNAALEMDKLGFEVTLVEKENELGGTVSKLSRLSQLLGNGNAEDNPAKRLARQVREASAVRILKNTRLKHIDGYVGNFQVHLQSADQKEIWSPFKVGAIIVATGSRLYRPDKKWRYGQAANVVTSMDMEEMLARRQDGNNSLLKAAKNAVFIQCIGSRSDQDGYQGCSRYCCPTTVRQAMELRKLGLDCTVLYRDMRMVGQGEEEFYRLARKNGVLFLRYHPDRLPSLEGDKKVDRIIFSDTLLNRDILVPTDLVVLAVGMMERGKEFQNLRTLLKIPQGSDGFLLERHPELGPVETCIEGVFICGTVQGPKDIDDSIVQAQAAAGKAWQLLNQEKICLPPLVCQVDQERCRQCGQCVEICQYQAPQIVSLEKGGEAAEINRALCKGCGTCAVWCPTSAIEACHYTDEQVNAMINALFEDYHV